MVRNFGFANALFAAASSTGSYLFNVLRLFGGARGARVATSSRVVARGRARGAITARREVTTPAPLGCPRD
jgi:hypothetical protein